MSRDFKTVEALEAHLGTLPRAQLVSMLTEVAATLSFDAGGEYNPEESVACNSGSDYVEQVTHMFHRNEISI